jgi:hypothetical protein
MSSIKKIFIISSVLLSAVLFLGGVYFFVFRNSSSNEDSESLKVANEKIDSLRNSIITPASSRPVLAPILTEDGLHIEYYSKDNGQVYKNDLNGEAEEAISQKELPGLIDVFWSPDKKKAITKFKKSNGEIQFFYYNHDTKASLPLKSNLDMVVWQNNNKILYKYFNPVTKERTLNISDPDGKNWTKIANLDFKNINIASVPLSGLISFWNQPDAFTETSFKTASMLGENKQTLFSGSFGTDYLWSGDGNRILASSSDKKGGSQISLFVMNNSGGDLKKLDVPTFTAKCVWSKDNKTIYYALPGGIQDNLILPNDYLSGKIKTTDTFWKINVLTGEKTRIIDLDKITASFDAVKMFLNSDESLLFFINRLDDKLYKITL